MPDLDRDAIYKDFKDAVNMAPAEIERWLDKDESREVGQKSGSHESVGHASGRRIVKLLRTKKADLTDDDYKHMQKVAGYVARHKAQGPDGDAKESPWRYSLMNWGHDPLKT